MMVREQSARARRSHVLGLACLLALIAYSATLRIYHTLRDANFDRVNAASLLRTDPALLYYVTERIAQNHGLPPSDFRADPNLEWPATTDIPAIETVGQEFYVAWSWLAFGRALPLHVWSVWVMSIWASLVAVGVYGAAYELTRKVHWAVGAAALWAVMLGNYRTLGFVLIREDFAFPWFALHAWLALRAARARTKTSFVLAGLSAVAAAATWHAMVFVLLIEAAALLTWFLRTGKNPLGTPWAWLAPLVAAVASLVIPVLWAKQFVLSLPMQIGIALALGGVIARRRGLSRLASMAAVLAAWGACFAVAKGLAAATSGGLADYSHVVDLLVAKVTHLGRQPADPRELSFGARLLWQGPFKTAELALFTRGLTAACIALAAGAIVFVPQWLRARGDARECILFLFVVVAAVASWLIERTAPLFGLAAPVLAVVVLARLDRARLAAGILALACLAHGVDQITTLSRFVNPWYALPPSPRENLELINWLSTHVPEGAAIASDFSTSAAILAHTRRPITQQPKYETVRSRERIESFCRALYRGKPAALAAWMRAHDCRWLVINRPFTGGNATDLGGILPSEFARYGESAVVALMNDNPNVYRKIPGFEFMHASPAELRFQSYRVWRLR